MSDSEPVHFITPKTTLNMFGKKMTAWYTACGADWKHGADIASKVTCPDCLKLIKK